MSITTPRKALRRAFLERGGPRGVFLGITVLLLLSYSWMFTVISAPNERSRVYLTAALVDDGTLHIDRSIKRFGRIVDVAKFDGHFYTDKAPGSSLAGAAVYGLVRGFTDAGDWSIDALLNLMRTYVMIPIGLIGFFLLRRFLSGFDLDPRVVDIASLGWIAASPAYHYSTAFYGHQIAAVALLLSLVLVRRPPRSFLSVPVDMLRMTAAGMAAGLAGITEYQSAVPCLLIFATIAVAERRHPGRIVAFSLGALPFVLLLMGYNRLAFGGPFELSYHHLVAHDMQVQHHFGVGGVTYPKGPAIAGTLFSLHRGLLFTAPLFVLFPVGVAHMIEDRQKLLGLVTGLSFTFYLFFVFSAHVWHGGWGFGSRLLVPGLVLAALPVTWAAHRWRKRPLAVGLICGMVVWGMGYHQLIHLVYQEPPDFSLNPALDIIVPALERGIVAPNLAFRITEAPGLWNTLPAIALVMILAVFVCWRGLSLLTGKRRKLLAGLVSLAVVAAFSAAVLLAGPSWKEKRSRRFVKTIERHAELEYGYRFEPRRVKNR